MKKLGFNLLMALFVAATLVGCKKDDGPDDEGELITTVLLTFTPAGGGASSTFAWRDIDLSGNPEIQPISLSAGTVYTLSVEILDETKNPAEDITEEIEEEDDEHQIFYFSNPGSLLTLTYQDEDAAGLPVGLSMRAVAGPAGSGTLRAVLKHAPGIKDGQFATGSTDFDVTFPVTLN
jgi:hypothetical protein